MYVIKRNSDYFTGADFSPLQRDAKRFYIGLGPDSSFPAYVAMLFGESARFVKLRSKRDTFGPFAYRFDDTEWP